MIRSLTGEISSHQEQRVVINVNGIGYLVYTNTNHYPYTIGDVITLHTHLAVRENALDLYGFTETRELEYFELLLTIPKIGPKSALQIICLASPDQLATAIILGDSERLHTEAGIGKKTATNIVTYLAGKIDTATVPDINNLSSTSQLSTAQVDAIDALVTLGYEQKEARTLVLKFDSTLDAKSLIQSALKQSPTS